MITVTTSDLEAHWKQPKASQLQLQYVISKVHEKSKSSRFQRKQFPLSVDKKISKIAFLFVSIATLTYFYCFSDFSVVIFDWFIVGKLFCNTKDNKATVCLRQKFNMRSKKESKRKIDRTSLQKCNSWDFMKIGKITMSSWFFRVVWIE